MSQKEDDDDAAAKFRDSIMHKRDGFVNGVYPYFHGWVIVEAFLAGLRAGRKEKKKESK